MIWNRQRGSGIVVKNHVTTRFVIQLITELLEHPHCILAGYVSQFPQLDGDLPQENFPCFVNIFPAMFFFNVEPSLNSILDVV